MLQGVLQSFAATRNAAEAAANSGTRTSALDDFLLGIHETDLAGEEIVTAHPATVSSSRREAGGLAHCTALRLRSPEETVTVTSAQRTP